jgi:hypothetical protein
MKTLDQTEPRIPIESLPVTITNGGSYYFTRDLQFTAVSGNAINVNASNVTIDLMGYKLSSTAGVTGFGININGDGCTVKNGSIVGTTTVTISGSGATRTWTVVSGGFNTGVSASRGGHRFVDLTVAKCRGSGLSGGAGDNNSVLTRCVAYQNGGPGILGGVVNECSAFENRGAGIDAGQNVGGVVTASRAYDNSQVGIRGNLVSKCLSQNNGEAGINAIKVEDCLASFNGGNGIESGTTTGSRARGNLGHGILGSHVTNNHCSTNGGAGIRFGGDGGRIEYNNCFDNAFGIQGPAGTNCFIVRNSCRGNSGTATNPGASGNFDFDRNTNTYGPVIVVNGDMSANAAASHPAANIQY